MPTRHTIVLWFDKNVKDTLLEVQIFDSEAEARKWLAHEHYNPKDCYPKIVKNIPVLSPKPTTHEILPV